MDKSKMSKKSQLIFGAVCAAILLICFVVVITAGSGPAYEGERIVNQPQPETKKEAPKPKEDTRDLDLSVKPRVLALEIKSNEVVDLNNCTVRINPGIIGNGFESKASIPAGQTVDLDYDNFTKNTERFDSSKYKVEAVVVSLCDGVRSRDGIYGY